LERLQQLNDEIKEITKSQDELKRGTFDEDFTLGFTMGMESMLESVRNFGVEAGTTFADFFGNVSEGFAKSVSDAILFGDSFKDSIGIAAREALSSLLSGLIKLGVQYVINAALADTVASTVVASQVAQAAVLSAAYATPAALVSLASYGANAAPATAGIASTFAFTKSLSFLKDGGPVHGAGGPRDDKIPAMLSNGEFVVNARSTSRFRPQIEAINSGRGFADGGQVDSSQQSAPVGNSAASQASGNTRIINIIDPNLLANYLSTPEGEEILVNVISSNSDRIKGVLG
jgi:hypothetical protein